MLSPEIARLAGLPAEVSEQAERSQPAQKTAQRRIARVWRVAWPRLTALALVLAAWQIVVWSGWRPSYVLPGPLPVFRRLGDELRSGILLSAVRVTMQRALLGYAIALVIGSAVGLAVARVSVLRAAVGSAISGLQSMPSVAWFPLAILLFKLSEQAILFVVVLGAAPAIANGLIAAVDHMPPLLLRAGRVMGARRLALYWYVVIPAVLPDFVSGLKQAWAFAWRSLLAGELLVVIAHKPSIGARLQFARDFSDAPGLIGWMIVILTIGVAIDALVFGPLQRTLREHRGLVGQ